MDDKRKKLANSLLKSLGGGEPDEAPMPMNQPPMASSMPASRPMVDPEAAMRAQRSMRKSFGGEESEQPQPSKEELDKLSGDLDRILKLKQQSPEDQDQNDELMRQLQLEYLRKKSLGQ